MLLACRKAFEDFSATDKDVRLEDTDLTKMSCMVAFVKLLADLGIRPIVAGYDEYISAFPTGSAVFTPESVRTLTRKKWNRANPEPGSGEPGAAEPGKKIGQIRSSEESQKSRGEPGGKVTVDKNWRDKHKKYYRVEDGVIKYSTHPRYAEIDWRAQWTDKPRAT